MGFVKKLKAVAAATKKAKGIGANLHAQFKDSQTTGEFIQKFLDSVKHGIVQVGIKSTETLRDEAAFASAIESAYSHLPLPYRMIVPKKLFAKLMHNLKGRLVFKDGKLEFDSEVSETVVSTLKNSEPKQQMLSN